MICTGQGGAPCYAGRVVLTARGVESSGCHASDRRVKGPFTDTTLHDRAGLQSTTLHARHVHVLVISLVLHDAVPPLFNSRALHDAVPSCLIIVLREEVSVEERFEMCKALFFETLLHA